MVTQEDISTRLETAGRSTRRRAARALALLLVAGIAPAAIGAEKDANRAPQAPADLRVDDRTRPLSVDGAPDFGWLPRDPDGNEVQTAYRLRVTRERGGLVWDSGRVVSSDQSGVRYHGPTLDRGASYEWTVQTWDRSGEPSPWAPTARFDTGISDGDWDASWIRRATTEADDYTLARKEISVSDSPVVRARAYVSANHTYELFLNGRRVDRGNSFDYPGEGVYQVADVTEAVQAGERLAIGVLYHWYGGGQGRAASERGLLLRLVVEHANGKREVVGTDGSWRVARATEFPTGTGSRNGEGDRIDRQDGRGVRVGWDRPGYDDTTTGWSAAEVIGSHPTSLFSRLTGLEARVVEREVAPVSVTRLSDGAYVADFGKVIPARPIVRFRNGQAGRSLNMLTGYLLNPDGHVSTAVGTQNTNMAFPYIQRDGAQEYRAFTHLGWRYLQIPDPGETLTRDDIAATVVHTDVPEDRAARFSSSDRTLDEVFELMKRSALYSIQETFVDTPTREKGQFLGDTVNQSYATMRALGERDATQKAIRDFLNSGERFWKGEGRLQAVYPNADGKRDIPDYTEMFSNWVWRYYQETGDSELLAEAYPMLRDIAAYVLRYRDATTGLITNLAGGGGLYEYGIVDFPPEMRYGYDMSTAARTTVNILGVDVLRVAAQATRALGKSNDDAAGYDTQATQLRDAINARLRRPDGLYSDGLNAAGLQSPHVSQHANSYALAFDIAPATDRQKIADYVELRGMAQGPMTAHWLLAGLAAVDRPEAVLRRLTDDTTFGWANVLKQGGTFTWESWVSRANPLWSESHGWGAQSVVDILETILGVHITAPGASELSIRPPKSGLDHAEGTVPTQRGNVDIAWRRSAAGMQLDVELPVNVTAEVALPAGGPVHYRATGAGAPTYLGLRDGRAIYRVGSGATRFVPAT